MNIFQRKLLVSQLDEKIKSFLEISPENIPSEGWIFTIRKALHMTRLQLANKMKKNVATIKEIEEREKNKQITLKKLEEAAEALDMKLVYGFIPKEGSIEKLIERRASKLADEIVLRTSQAMKLEDQENREERIKKSVEEKTEQLVREVPKYLWD